VLTKTPLQCEALVRPGGFALLHWMPGSVLSCAAGCSLAYWEQAQGTEAEAAERDALLAVLAREQQTCKVGSS